MRELVKPFLFWLDDQRLRGHFKQVERILRARDVRHLPEHSQLTRARHLDQLHFYGKRGIFPRNHDRAGWTPCFIDRDGRECAVAHLVMESGHVSTAQHIAKTSNNAYVLEMNFPELDQWASESGFTTDELALIQPSYVDPELIGSYAHIAFSVSFGWSLMVMTGILALITSVITTIPIPYQRLKKIAIGLGMGISIVLMLYVAFDLLLVLEGISLLSQANAIVSPLPDAEVMLAQAAFPALILQFVFTLIVSLIAFTLSVRGWRKIRKSASTMANLQPAQ